MKKDTISDHLFVIRTIFLDCLFSDKINLIQESWQNFLHNFNSNIFCTNKSWTDLY